MKEKKCRLNEKREPINSRGKQCGEEIITLNIYCLITHY